MNSASCQCIQNSTAATPTRVSTDTTKPDIDEPRKPSMALRSVTKCEVIRPAPTVSNSDKAMRDSRASMRTRMRYTTSLASSENVRPCHTLSKIAVSLSATVSSNAAPMNSTGPCQAAGNTAPILATKAPGWCNSTSSTISGSSSGTGTAAATASTAMTLACSRRARWRLSSSAMPRQVSMTGYPEERESWQA